LEGTETRICDIKRNWKNSTTWLSSYVAKIVAFSR